MPRINLLHVALVAFGILAAACGGESSSGSDNGIAIAIVGSPVARANLTAVVPGLRPGNLTPGIGANLPQGVPSIQVPQVTTGSTTGACALLTKQDAAAALGGPVNDAKSVDIPKQSMGTLTVDISSCDYDRTTGNGSVSLQTWRAGDANAVKTMGGIVCQAKEKVAGLGDVACWYGPDHRELQAFKGSSFLSVTTRGVASEDVVKSLMKAALDRVK